MIQTKQVIHGQHLWHGQGKRDLLTLKQLWQKPGRSDMVLTHEPGFCATLLLFKVFTASNFSVTLINFIELDV